MNDAGLGARFHALRVAEVRAETDQSVSISFVIPEALRDAFAYVPGQYLTLRAVLGGEEVRRSYSICSGLDDGEIRVGIKHVPDGVFSHFANTALQSGDTLEVMPPMGRFGVAIGGAARNYVGIAAGSGITPVLAILKSVLTREPASRFVLVYGSRSTRDIMFREVLEDLKDRFLDCLSVFHILSREQQDIAALSGRIDADRLAALLPTVMAPGDIDHAFICGPEGLIETAAGALAGMGVEGDRVHVERFGTSVRAAVRPESAAPGLATATIIFEGKTNIVPIAPGEAVLDAALRAGLDLPWSCRGGMCSTCRAHLTDGAAEMAQNFSLEPWEMQAGFILTCQAHPTTNHVTVDYDRV